MKTLHICNVNFEWDLGANSKLGLKESFMVHPNFMQFQFLPLLYGKEGDGVVVTHPPPIKIGKMNIHLFDEKVTGYDRIETWGWSKRIEEWTDLPYEVPPCLREVASKKFSFTHSPKLPGGKLLHHSQEVEKWIETGSYPKVLKTCYGFSGRGHFVLNNKDEYSRVKESVFKELEKGHPLIGEPWVKRQMDFSTQWFLGDEISFLGATILENSESGTYNKTLIGKEIPFLEEQKEKAKIILRIMQEMGFRGNVGIDAMVYDNILHPIVEINPRKTMGWLALKLGESLSYENGSEGVLPTFLMAGKKIPFQKQLKLL